jgi:hypothetical protein
LAQVNHGEQYPKKTNWMWSGLGFRPVEWLRVWIAGQRTRIYGGDRDYQRGPFAQVTWRDIAIGGYWFNPDLY